MSLESSGRRCVRASGAVAWGRWHQAGGAVGAGRGALDLARAGEHDRVHRPVELTVAHAVGAVADRLPGEGTDRQGAAEHRGRAVLA